MPELPVEAALPLLGLACGTAFFAAAELAFRWAVEDALRGLESGLNRRIAALRREAPRAPEAARLEEIRDGFRSLLARHGLADPPPARRFRSGPRPGTPPPARSG